MNDCKFVGRLTADPAVHSLPGGNMVTKFTIAVNFDRKSKNGETVHEEVAYIDCEVWDKAAEIVATEYNKGSKIMVEARAKTESWTDKATGNKRSALRFRVNRFYPIDSHYNRNNKENEDYVPQSRPHDSKIDAGLPF